MSDEYTNILLDQHMHCMNITLTPPLQPSTANMSMLQHSYGMSNSRSSSNIRFSHFLDHLHHLLFIAW